MKILNYYIKRSKVWVANTKNYVSLLRQAISKGGSLGSHSMLRNSQYVHLGHNVKIADYFRIECYSEYLGQHLSPKLTIGDGSNIGPDFTALVADDITIGARNLFAGGVILVSENHGINPIGSDCYQKESLTTGAINIGNGCWLGQNVVVLPGVTIGERSIIGANAVVSNDIPPYSIAVGMPAKVIKRFNLDTNNWEKV